MSALASAPTTRLRLVLFFIAIALTLAAVCVGSASAGFSENGNCDGTHEDNTGLPSGESWHGVSFLPTESGYYYLTNDVTLYETWEPADGTYLCLNGQKITYDSWIADSEKIGVYDEFTLYDCQGTGVIYDDLSSSCCVYVSGGSFTMYGGTITGTSGTMGPGVYVSNSYSHPDNTFKSHGSFTMCGGTIKNTGNPVDGDGGGVSVSGGSFTMYGGTIEDNKGIGYSGVYVGDAYRNGNLLPSGFGSAALHGGTITDNTKGNLYLPGGKTVTIGTLDLSAEIGVTVENAATHLNSATSEPIQIATCDTYADAQSYIGENNNGRIRSDNTDYKIIAKTDGTLYLAHKDYVEPTAEYYITVPDSVAIPTGSTSETFEVSVATTTGDSIPADTTVTVIVSGANKVEGDHSFYLLNSGDYLKYTLKLQGGTALIQDAQLTFTSTTSTQTLTVALDDTPHYAGTYTDTLTFTIETTTTGA